jgi:hypothetical protein
MSEDAAVAEPLVYETMPVGERVGPFTYVVPRDYNRKRFASYSIGDAIFVTGRDGSEYAEPSFLCGQHSWVMRRRFSWGGSVHAKCDIVYLKPVCLGATIHVTGEISGKYERRGGRYAVFRLQTTDDAGDLVCRVENTMLLNFREVAALRKQSRDAPQPSGASRSADIPGPSLALSFGPKPLWREDILHFFQAEEDVYGLHPSIHNVEAIAQAAGLADIIAPGRYSIGLLNCMFARLYGERWLRGGTYAVSFLQNLLPGVVAQVQASPNDRAAVDATTAAAFDVCCRDAASGRTVLAGKASLPGDGAGHVHGGRDVAAVGSATSPS